MGKLFEKGKSGNPRGRPKKDFELAEKAQVHAGACLDVLIDIALTCEAPAVRVSACKEILDRGFGKAPQSLVHSGDVNLSLGDELDAFVRRVKQHREQAATGDSQLH